MYFLRNTRVNADPGGRVALEDDVGGRAFILECGTDEISSRKSHSEK
jgi:hypothetical protein